MTALSRQVTILYATETYTALSLSQVLRDSLFRHHIYPSLIAFDEYNDPWQLRHENVVIFICSTTGQGEFPVTARAFWKFLLRKNLGNKFLDGVKVAGFGLGDSSYAK